MNACMIVSVIIIACLAWLVQRGFVYFLTHADGEESHW
jgi:hypothetical protein